MDRTNEWRRRQATHKTLKKSFEAFGFSGLADAFGLAKSQSHMPI